VKAYGKSFQKLFILLWLLLSILLCGCWNYREIEDLTIVAGAALDKEGDMYILTFEVIDVAGGPEKNHSSALIKASGLTLFEASRNAISVIGNKLYWSHAKMMIISEDIAKEGLVPVMDWLARDAEIRQTIKIVVSKEKTAREILEITHPTIEVVSLAMDQVFQNKDSVNSVPRVEEWKLFQDLAQPGVSTALPTVYINEENGNKRLFVSGSAIFDKDRLIGYLNDEETKLMMFVKNEITRGLITEKIEHNDIPIKISLEILKSQTEIKPVVKDDEIKFEIDMTVHGNIGEIEGYHFHLDRKGANHLEKNFEELLNKNIAAFIKTIQKEYGVDIFGFADALSARDPKTWKKVEPRWKEVFKNVEVTVNSEVHIEGAAIQKKPIRIRE
jgi:spore germination protein KC